MGMKLCSELITFSLFSGVSERWRRRNQRRKVGDHFSVLCDYFQHNLNTDWNLITMWGERITLLIGWAGLNGCTDLQPTLGGSVWLRVRQQTAERGWVKMRNKAQCRQPEAHFHHLREDPRLTTRLCHGFTGKQPCSNGPKGHTSMLPALKLHRTTLGNHSISLVTQSTIWHRL